MTFQKATKLKSKLRCALFGPSGSGKTYTALRIATGMLQSGIGGRIALIDTERGSASKYADRFDFDVCDLEKRDIDNYVNILDVAKTSGYSIVIIDSLSHAWQELLSEIDKIAKSKYKGNTWSAWSDGTPKQMKLINALLDYPGHIIATMRSKTEWVTSQDGNGKTRPQRVGMAPEQGKGIEYEFDLLLELSVDHVCNVIKDRTGKYQDAIFDKPDENLGKELIQWLNEGHDPAAPKSAIHEIAYVCQTEYNLQNGNITKLLSKIVGRKIKSSHDLTLDESTQILQALKDYDTVYGYMIELNFVEPKENEPKKETQKDVSRQQEQPVPEITYDDAKNLVQDEIPF